MRKFKSQQFQNCYDNYIKATNEEIEIMTNRTIQKGILDSKFYQGYTGEEKWIGSKDCLTYAAYIAGVDRSKAKVIKYIPAHLQNSIARVKFGDIFVQRLRLVDSYRYRVFNATNMAKIHIYDTDTGKELCNYRHNLSYQFTPQDETEYEMQLFHIKHYCKKCLAKCEIIEE